MSLPTKNASTQPTPKGCIPLAIFFVGTIIFVVYMMNISRDPTETQNMGSEPKPTPAVGSMLNETPASKLASVDTGDFVDASNPIAQKYQMQIDSLRGIYGLDDQKIINIAYASQQNVVKKGIDQSVLSVLESVNNAVQRSTEPPGLIAMFAAYATLRVQGLSKEQAISQSEEFVRLVHKKG